MIKITTILMALLASSRTMFAITPLGLPSTMHEFACTPASEPQQSGGVADELRATNSVTCIVVALNYCQIGLLQLTADGTTPQVVVYQHGDATTMPGDATVGPGDNVIMTFLELPNQLPLVTSIHRLPVEENTAATLAATATLAPMESAVQPPVIILPSIMKGPPQYGADDPLEVDSGPGELPPEEQYHPCPIDADNSDQVERFTFGKVVSFLPRGLMLSEFDFAEDANVEAFYEFQAETKYGDISVERPLHLGDDVVLDYLDDNGRRLVTTIVREHAVEIAGSSPSEESGCCMTEANGDTPSGLLVPHRNHISKSTSESGS